MKKNKAFTVLFAPGGNYLPALRDLIASGAADGGAHEITVSHDDFCRIFDGGSCDCRPDVSVKAKGRR